MSRPQFMMNKVAIGPGRAYAVSRAIAHCPECSGRLTFEVDEWEAETGLIGEAGVHLSCTNERYDALDEQSNHRWWQGEWQPVIDRVTAWVRKWYYVRE